MDITTGIIGLSLLACAYSAQYWAKRCYDELREIKEAMRRPSEAGAPNHREENVGRR